MGSLNSNAKHRSFLLDILNDMTSKELDEMKFVLGDEISLSVREGAAPLKFLEILGQLRYWTIEKDGCVRFAQFADLCEAIKRKDLKKKLNDYEMKFGSCVVLRSNFPIVEATDAEANGAEATDIEADGSSPPNQSPFSSSEEAVSTPGCSAVVFDFIRTLLGKN